MLESLSLSAVRFIATRHKEIQSWAEQAAKIHLSVSEKISNPETLAKVEVLAHNWKARRFNIYTLCEMAAFITLCSEVAISASLAYIAATTAALVYCIFQTTIYGFAAQNLVFSTEVVEAGYKALLRESVKLFGMDLWKFDAKWSYIAPPAPSISTPPTILDRILNDTEPCKEEERSELRRIIADLARVRIPQVFTSLMNAIPPEGLRNRLQGLFKVTWQNRADFIDAFLAAIHTQGEMAVVCCLISEALSFSKKPKELTFAEMKPYLQLWVQQKLDRPNGRETFRDLRPLLGDPLNSLLQQRLAPILQAWDQPNFAEQFIAAFETFQDVALWDQFYDLSNLQPVDDSDREKLARDLEPLKHVTPAKIQPIVEQMFDSSVKTRLLAACSERDLYQGFCSAVQTKGEMSSVRRIVLEPMEAARCQGEISLTERIGLFAALRVLPKEKGALEDYFSSLRPPPLKERLIAACLAKEDRHLMDVLETRDDLRVLEKYVLEKMATSDEPCSPEQLGSLREMLLQFCSYGIPPGFKEVIQSLPDAVLKGKLLRVLQRPFAQFVDNFVGQVTKIREFVQLMDRLSPFFIQFQQQSLLQGRKELGQIFRNFLLGGAESVESLQGLLEQKLPHGLLKNRILYAFKGSNISIEEIEAAIQKPADLDVMRNILQELAVDVMSSPEGAAYMTSPDHIAQMVQMAESMGMRNPDGSPLTPAQMQQMTHMMMAGQRQ